MDFRDNGGFAQVHTIRLSDSSQQMKYLKIQMIDFQMVLKRKTLWRDQGRNKNLSRKFVIQYQIFKKGSKNNSLSLTLTKTRTNLESTCTIPFKLTIVVVAGKVA